MPAAFVTREDIEKAKQVVDLLRHPGWLTLMNRARVLVETRLTALRNPKVGFDEIQLARGFLQYPDEFGALIAEFIRVSDTPLSGPEDEQDGPNYR